MTIEVHTLMEYRPSQPVGLQKLNPIIRASRSLIRMQSRNNENVKAIFDLINKLTRLEISYLSWLDHSQHMTFLIKK